MKGECLELAEKIVNSLIEQGMICFDETLLSLDKPQWKDQWITAISKALNLTYGETTSVTFRNQKGEIVAKLWIKPDGTLADDSWLSPLGWR